MTAAEAIAHLDAALAKFGTDIVLRRVDGGNHDKTMRASMRVLSEGDMGAGIGQARGHVVLSPTGLAGWPGSGETASARVADPSLPRKLDQVIVAGRTFEVTEPARPVYMGGTLVRVTLVVAG